MLSGVCRASITSIALIVFSCQIHAQQPLEFNRDIRPLLAENCFACHGTDSKTRAAGLRLDLRDEAIDGGAITPGKPDESDLIERIFSDDPDQVMPPPDTKKKLTAEQKEKLKRWIASGAKYQTHWSFQAPQKSKLPSVKNKAWIKTPIDQFVLAKLEAQKLTPAREANPRTLFRRVHLDITGLPPKPADIDAFEKDYLKQRDRALSEWIDRLMKSTAWGEHRARYWLDAARYGDTHGLHYDNYREMWPYRDWVIRSFNRNQPFDKFTVEQIAGDLLKNPSIDQKIATGFQRCNITTNEGGTIEAENLALYAADRVQTLGWVFLGLTTNCAQCHDHKFDPISTKEYYSMAAFFRNTTQTGLDGNSKDGKGPVIRVPLESDLARWKVIDSEIAKTTKARDLHRKNAKAPFDRWLEKINAEVLEKQIPTKGRIAFIPLNDGKGNNPKALISTEGESPSLKSTGDLNWSVNGKFGKAIQFQPGKTIVAEKIGDFAKGQPFSHSEWIRTPRLNQHSAPIARMDVKNNFRGWDLYFSNGHLAVHLIHKWPNDAIKVTTRARVIKKNQWHHIAVTWDGSGKQKGISIYVDGVKQPTRVEANSLKPKSEIRTETPFRIGQRSETAVFHGSVQDFHLFNRLLTKAEIGALRNAQLLVHTLGTPAEKRTAQQKKALLEHYLDNHDAQYRKLAETVESLKKEKSAMESRSPITHIQVEQKNKPAMANILMRGQYDKVGKEVSATTPAALHPFPKNAPKNRLGLAQWIVHSDNPLTARVTVNRFWQEVFGRGIVETSEDFGIMGTLPTHPQLLDWLAVEFRESGWDVKHIFKLILMSATYRQAAIATPEKLLKDRHNLLFSRGPRFRMDAEMVRDHALASSGLLSRKMYGPGVKPYQPEGIWDVVGLPGGNTRKYVQDKGDNLYRRTLYTFIKRMAPPPNLEIFNATSREVCTVRRERTNTPLQALVTLNDPQFVEAARVLAQNALSSAKTENEILDFIAQQVLGRPLNEKEKGVMRSDRKQYLAYYQSKPDAAKKLIAVGESKAPEKLDASTLAAWTIICNQVMNLDEALNK